MHDKIGEYSISEERLYALTGHSWENIIFLRSIMTSMRKSENRSITQALITFLCKLRTGQSDNVLSAILGIKNEKIVFGFIHSVLKMKYCQNIFGFNTNTIESLI